MHGWLAYFLLQPYIANRRLLGRKATSCASKSFQNFIYLALSYVGFRTLSGHIAPTTAEHDDDDASLG